MAKLILQVEDSDDDARLLALAFAKAGIANQIITVSNGEEALCYFKGEGVYADRDKYPLPGVLLLDLKLPGINGFDLLEMLIKHSFAKEVFTVVISGHNEIFQVSRAYEMGAKSFLTKPIQQADVANLVKGFQGHWTFAS